MTKDRKGQPTPRISIGLFCLFVVCLFIWVGCFSFVCFPLVPAWRQAALGCECLFLSDSVASSGRVCWAHPVTLKKHTMTSTIIKTSINNNKQIQTAATPQPDSHNQPNLPPCPQWTFHGCDPTAKVCLCVCSCAMCIGCSRYEGVC